MRPELFMQVNVNGREVYMNRCKAMRNINTEDLQLKATETGIV